MPSPSDSQSHLHVPAGSSRRLFDCTLRLERGQSPRARGWRPGSWNARHPAGPPQPGFEARDFEALSEGTKNSTGSPLPTYRAGPRPRGAVRRGNWRPASGNPVQPADVLTGTAVAPRHVGRSST
jgi:hypothetical protein